MLLNKKINEIHRLYRPLLRHHGYQRLLDKTGTVTIVTQRVIGESAVVSMLTLLNPTPDRAGVYACRPEHLDPVYVWLHIVQGKTSLATAAVTGNLKVY